VELATVFHFPDQKNMPTSQLGRQESKQVDGPRNMSDNGLALGYNVFRGTKKRVVLDPEDRRRHMYVVGQTGVGKSVFLENMAVQDMMRGDGFAFIDPHGDTAEKLLSMVPKERTEDVIYFCPADMEYPLGLNLFEFDHPDQQDFLIQEAINMLYKLYDPQHQGIIGPRYEHWFRMAARTIMSDPAGSTFIDIPKVFTDSKYAKQKLLHVTDRVVLDFWNKEMASTSDYHKSEVLGWFVSKFGAFMANEMMRNIIGQTKSSFNLREIMDNKKILLVNLSKGRTGELNSKLLGMIFVMKFQAAAMSRANIDEEDRKDFCLYVDEFQNFSTDSFATILSEARKYRLNLIVANQFTTQLSEEIRDAVFGNIGTIASFRVGTNDAEFLAKYFSPVFDSNDLQRTPNYNSIMKMLIGGVPSQPFSLTALPPIGTPNRKLGEALKQLSAAKHGRPRLKVEEEIFERLKTIDDEPVASTGPAGGFGQGTRPPQRPQAPKSGSSFLDDWLNKRQAPFQPPATGFGKQNPAPPVQQQSAQPILSQPAPAVSTTPQPIQPVGTVAQNPITPHAFPVGQTPSPAQPTVNSPVVSPTPLALPIEGQVPVVADDKAQDSPQEGILHIRR
ncbi:MAG: TraM recognition domain-containing protein, partial [bacterium]|nr:TraM recognition domain-containing protein [bacterium]